MAGRNWNLWLTRYGTWWREENGFCDWHGTGHYGGKKLETGICDWHRTWWREKTGICDWHGKSWWEKTGICDWHGTFMAGRNWNLWLTRDIMAGKNWNLWLTRDIHGGKKMESVTDTGHSWREETGICDWHGTFMAGRNWNLWLTQDIMAGKNWVTRDIMVENKLELLTQATRDFLPFFFFWPWPQRSFWPT